jgi:branched-chain amino acid transport system substrate-binding protein
MRTWKQACAVLIAVGAPVAACGSNHNGATKSTSAAAVTTAVVPATAAAVGTTGPAGPPTGKPIVFALVGEFSAGGSDMTGFLTGTEAWAAQLNHNGGLFGRPVELRRCNSKYDPAAATACAQDAAADPDVLGIVGGIDGLYAPVIGPAAKAAGMIAIPAYSASLADGQMATGFVPSPGGRGHLSALPAYLVKKVGLTRIATIRADVEATAPNADLVKAAVEAAGGKYAGDVRVPLTASDMLPAVTEAAAAGAQVIIPSVSNAGAIGVINAIRDGGFAGQIAIATSPTFYGDKAIEAAVKDAGIDWYFSSETDLFFNKDNPLHDGYLAAMDLVGNADKSVAQCWLSYRSGRVLQAILEAAGPDLSRASILNAAMTGSFDVEGKLAPLHRDVDPKNPAYTSDGTYVMKYPDEILTASAVSVLAAAP